MRQVDDLLAEASGKFGQGQLDEALALAQQALGINPGNPNALHLTGILLAQVGQTQAAEAHLKKAVVASKKNGTTDSQLIINYATFLRQLERLSEAEPHLQALLQADPENRLANMLYGQILVGHDEKKAALPYLIKAAEPNESGAEPCYRLGRVFEDLDDPASAESCFRTAIARDPKNSIAYNYYGLFLTDQNRAQDAVTCLLESLKNATSHESQILYNLGNAYMGLNQFDQAIDAYCRALELAPDSAETHAHLGFALMSKGIYPEGFAEYEWRLKTKEFLFPVSDAPTWNGDVLNGKTILLIGEQGFGDVLQFLRFIPEVAQRKGRIILRAPAALRDLLTRVPDIDAVITPEDPLPDHDYAARLMSLPGILKTTPATIPADTPYLSAPEDKTQEWQKRLQDFNNTKVGLVWMGNPDQKKNKFRSCPVEALGPLTEIPGVQLFSLQKHAHGEPFTLPSNTINLGREFQDFTDTAAAIANMDVVISVCTSVAHLTGALGKPLWVMLAYAPDWRWMLEDETTPWYPSARLFRQQSPGDWAGVVERVAEALKKHAAA